MKCLNKISLGLADKYKYVKAVIYYLHNTALNPNSKSKLKKASRGRNKVIFLIILDSLISQAFRRPPAQNKTLIYYNSDSR